MPICQSGEIVLFSFSFLNSFKIDLESVSFFCYLILQLSSQLTNDPVS